MWGGNISVCERGIIENKLIIALATVNGTDECVCDVQYSMFSAMHFGECKRTSALAEINILLTNALCS